MSITYRIFAFVLFFSIILSGNAQEKNKGLSISIIPASTQLADLNKRFNRDDIPENFSVEYFKALTPEFSLTYLSKYRIGKFYIGASIGHKSHQINYRAVLTGGEIVGNILFWEHRNEFKYDILYFKPILQLDISERALLQFGLEISKSYKIEGGFDSQITNFIRHSFFNPYNGYELYSKTYKIERTNPVSKENMIYHSCPEILFLYGLTSNLSLQVGLKLNFGFWGGGRFLDLYEYDESEEEWKHLYYAAAKKTMTGTVGISYNLSSLRNR